MCLTPFIFLALLNGSGTTAQPASAARPPDEQLPTYTPYPTYTLPPQAVVVWQVMPTQPPLPTRTPYPTATPWPTWTPLPPTATPHRTATAVEMTRVSLAIDIVQTQNAATLTAIAPTAEPIIRAGTVAPAHSDAPVNPAALIVAALGVALIYAVRWASPRRAEIVAWLMDVLKLEPVPPDTPRIIDAGEIMFTVNGQRITQREYWVHTWRLWLRRFWVTWAHFGHCGRDRFLDLTNASRPVHWEPAMRYFQALKLVRVEPGKPAEILVDDEKTALSIIGQGVLVPMPDRPAPPYIQLANPFDVEPSPIGDPIEPPNPSLDPSW